MNKALFWALVRNEINQFKSRINRKPFKIAIGFFLLMAFAGLLVWKARHGEPIRLEQKNMEHFLFHFIGFMAFALSLNSISREWKDGTFYWWMSLPYSRWPMLWAKLIGVMLNSFRIFLYFYVAVKVSSAIVLYFQDPGQFSSLLWDSFITDAKSFPQAIPFAFALSAMGFFISCLMFSRFRPYAPLCWIGVGLIISWLIHLKFLGLFAVEILFGVLVMSVNSLLLSRYMEAK